MMKKNSYAQLIDDDDDDVNLDWDADWDDVVDPSDPPEESE